MEKAGIPGEGLRCSLVNGALFATGPDSPETLSEWIGQSVWVSAGGIYTNYTITAWPSDYPGGGCSDSADLDVTPFVDLDVSPCIKLNDDDDNENGIADNDEGGIVSNENDLAAMTVLVRTGGGGGTARLEALSGGSNIRIWDGPATNAAPVTLPKTWDPAPATIEETLYVEGIEVSESVTNIEFRLRYTPDPSTNFDDTVKTTVIKVELKSIEFTTDYDILRNNNENWLSTGDIYQEPKWLKDRAECYPVVHKMGEEIGLKAALDISPSELEDVTITLNGDGPDNSLDFEATETFSSGGIGKTITLTANEALAAQIDKLDGKEISWTATLSVGGVTLESISLGVGVQRDLERHFQREMRETERFFVAQDE